MSKYRLAVLAIVHTLLATHAYAGNTFIPVPFTVAGNALAPYVEGARTTDNSGMSDPGNPTRFGLHDNDGAANFMWVTGANAVANGADPSTTAYILFVFSTPVNIDEMLVWNFNQGNQLTPLPAYNRGIRQADITYSVGSDTSGLGNILLDDVILNGADGQPDLAFTDSISFGTPGVGIDNIRAVRISAQGSPGIGNYGGTTGSESLYGLSEVRFFTTTVPEPAAAIFFAMSVLCYATRHGRLR